MVEITFSHFQEGLSLITPNYNEFVHETSHIKPSKYDSTSVTTISICLKTNWEDKVVNWNKHL